MATITGTQSTPQSAAPIKSAPAVDLDLSVVMPCLNERLTLATCIRKALETTHHLGIRAEVFVADNGCSDGSQAIAESRGGRVVAVEARGYGNSLHIVIPGFVSLTLGIQVVLSSFFISLLGMARQ